MKKSIYGPRFGCALQGALDTLIEIDQVVPVIHSIAGCGVSNAIAHRTGKVDTGRINGMAVAGTNVFEKQVIFGGGSRLREELKNATKVYKGELFVVLNSCESAMVGDDIIGMTNELSDQGFQAVHLENTSGFKGIAYAGYEQVFTAVISQLASKPDADSAGQEEHEKTVNILGILPGTDPYFRGTLDTLTTLLNNAGLKVNRFFGTPDGVAQLQNITRADATLVFSKWGYVPAKKLEDQYGIPFLYYPAVPVGAEQVERLLTELDELLGLDQDRLQALIAEQRQRFAYYYKGIRQTLISEFVFRDVAVVGVESTVLAVGSFLRQYMGANIKAAIVTDAVARDDVDIPESGLRELAEEVYETSDTGEIRRTIESNGIEVLLASSLEKPVADLLGIPFLSISYPVTDRIILSKSYAGVDGAVSMIEDYVEIVT